MLKENKLDRCLNDQNDQDIFCQDQILPAFQDGDIKLIFKILRSINRQLSRGDFGGNIQKTDNDSPFAPGRAANQMEIEINRLLKDFQAGRRSQLEIQLSHERSIIIKVMGRNQIKVELLSGKSEDIF